MSGESTGPALPLGVRRVLATLKDPGTADPKAEFDKLPRTPEVVPLLAAVLDLWDVTALRDKITEWVRREPLERQTEPARAVIAQWLARAAASMDEATALAWLKWTIDGLRRPADLTPACVLTAPFAARFATLMATDPAATMQRLDVWEPHFSVLLYAWTKEQRFQVAALAGGAREETCGIL